MLNAREVLRWQNGCANKSKGSADICTSNSLIGKIKPVKDFFVAGEVILFKITWRLHLLRQVLHSSTKVKWIFFCDDWCWLAPPEQKGRYMWHLNSRNTVPLLSVGITSSLFLDVVGKGNSAQGDVNGCWKHQKSWRCSWQKYSAARLQGVIVLKSSFWLLSTWLHYRTP